MKINKKNPVHWMCLILLMAHSLIAVFFRPLFRKSRRQKPSVVILYGHRLADNLLPLYERFIKHHEDELLPVFLTMDSTYCQSLKNAGFNAVSATHLSSVGLLTKANAVISTHGLHSMTLMVWLSDLKFFDVWHGIPYKGFNADDFRVQHRYHEVWVASPLLKSLYVEKFGFREEKVVSTGYARTDSLIQHGANRDEIAEIKMRLGLDAPDVGRVILFAPTWQQDKPGRNLYPFGLDETIFLDALSEFATRHQATVVVRAHLNSSMQTNHHHERIVYRPFADYPETDQLLLVSDILVCDWSSLSFDYLLLQRPTVFLDIEPPFAKGFSLGPEYRHGAIVKDLQGLIDRLDVFVGDPESFEQHHGAYQREILQKVYGGYADGEATKRCAARLLAHLSAE